MQLQEFELFNQNKTDKIPQTCRDEQGGSLGNNTLVALLHLVPEEHFALIGRGAPRLI